MSPEIPQSKSIITSPEDFDNLHVLDEKGKPYTFRRLRRMNFETRNALLIGLSEATDIKYTKDFVDRAGGA